MFIAFSSIAAISGVKSLSPEMTSFRTSSANLLFSANLSTVHFLADSSSTISSPTKVGAKGVACVKSYFAIVFLRILIIINQDVIMYLDVVMNISSLFKQAETFCIYDTLLPWIPNRYSDNNILRKHFAVSL